MKITRRHLLKIIQEEVESVRESEKASKSKGKPYKGSRRGKTESQAQQMAAGIALSARRKYGKKGAIKKLRGAPKSMADMSMKDLVKLATIRRGSEVPDSTKKGHERAALPGHIAESDVEVVSAGDISTPWVEKGVAAEPELPSEVKADSSIMSVIEHLALGAREVWDIYHSLKELEKELVYLPWYTDDTSEGGHIDMYELVAILTSLSKSDVSSAYKKNGVPGIINLVRNKAKHMGRTADLGAGGSTILSIPRPTNRSAVDAMGQHFKSTPPPASSDNLGTNEGYKMKITRKQLRQTIREELGRIVEADTDGDGALDADEIRQLASDLEGESQEPLRVWGIPYKSGFAYGGRRVISRDRAWLEFVPKGNGPDTKEDMFRSVTLLEPGDPEVQKVIDNPRNSWYVRKYLKNTPLEKFDVYSVYAHTTG